MLYLRTPLEGVRLELTQAPASLRPPRSLAMPFSLSKSDPGAGNIKEIILVPTGDSLGTF